MAIHITGDDAADQVLTDDPFALLVGMLLDQQVPMETAFAGPAKIRDRMGSFDAESIAAADPEAFAAVFKESPAVHRFPGSMAGRVQALAGRTLPRIAARHGFALVSCSTLPSVAAKGLYRRIRYSKDVPAPKAALMAAAITVASPLLAVLPADIRVWVFRRG